MGRYVTKDLIERECISLSLNDHILHTAMEACLSWSEGSKAARSDVTSQEQWVVGVSGAHSRDSDSRLSKDLVD